METPNCVLLLKRTPTEKRQLPRQPASDVFSESLQDGQGLCQDDRDMPPAGLWSIAILPAQLLCHTAVDSRTRCAPQVPPRHVLFLEHTVLGIITIARDFGFVFGHKVQSTKAQVLRGSEHRAQRTEEATDGLACLGLACLLCLHLHTARGPERYQYYRYSTAAILQVLLVNFGTPKT